LPVIKRTVRNVRSHAHAATLHAPQSIEAFETNVKEFKAATEAKLPHIGLPMIGWTVGIDYGGAHTFSS
jgi:hypothetical protein